METLMVETIPPELEHDSTNILVWARSLVIAKPEDYTAAGTWLSSIKALNRRITDWFAPMKQQAAQVHKSICAKEKEMLAPLAEAERLAKTAMLLYSRAEEEKRLAEQRKLQAEADEKARKERDALLKKAQASKKPETQQKYAEAAASVVAPVVAVQSEAPKINGLTTRKIWKARVTDPILVPREFMLVDEAKLDRYAKAMREAATVPGVMFFQEEILASRAT